MTQSEALSKARHEWGTGSIVTHLPKAHPNLSYQISPPNGRWNGKWLIGIGDSWEAAFRDAKEKAQEKP